MKRIFAGSLCTTKQKLYVVIFVALIVAALLITSIVLYTRNIVRMDESSMPTEISGLYVGLNGIGIKRSILSLPHITRILGYICS